MQHKCPPLAALAAPSFPPSIAAAQEKRGGGLPASIQNVALDELQRMFVDSLKKLKARDKRIADLAEAQKAVAAENAALREQVAARPTEPNGADSRLQVRAPLPVRLVCILPWLQRLAPACLAPAPHLCAVAAQAVEAQLAAERERAARVEAALTALQREHEAALAALRQESDAALAALRGESQAALAGAQEQGQAAAAVAQKEAEEVLAAAREQAGAARRQLQDARDETAVLAEQVRRPRRESVHSPLWLLVQFAGCVSGQLTERLRVASAVLRDSLCLVLSLEASARGQPYTELGVYHVRLWVANWRLAMQKE